MARPSFLVCDTDAVVQFLLAQEVRPLRLLRFKYSIQPVVVPEVEIELLSFRWFGGRIPGEFKKVLASGHIRILDHGILAAHYGNPVGPMAATAAIAKIAALGNEYEAHVDFGEAYTHAAALTLEAPALSHDRSALDALIGEGLAVPSTVLRVFDLVCLSYQTKDMTERDCDEFRSMLLGEKEFIPKSFEHKSFVDGLLGFCPRIRDSRIPAIGSAKNPSLPYSGMIIL